MSFQKFTTVEESIVEIISFLGPSGAKEVSKELFRRDLAGMIVCGDEQPIPPEFVDSIVISSGRLEYNKDGEIMYQVIEDF